MRTRILAVLAVCAMCTGVSANKSDSWCGLSPWLRDNLFVKVDVGEGALKIGTTASFKVYVMNTYHSITSGTGATVDTFYDAMLRVVTDEFTATVTQSPTWTSYPDLPSVKVGGRAEYFTVQLARKSGVPDGDYSVDLELYSSKNVVPSRRLARVFTINDAMDMYRLQQAPTITIDGRATAEEWGTAAVCSDFRAMVLAGPYGGPPRSDSISSTPRDPSRVRVCGDNANVYACCTFMGGVGALTDSMAFYFSPTITGTPVRVAVSGKDGGVSSSQGTAGILSQRDSANCAIELKIPRTLVGIGGASSFCLNVVRRVAYTAKTENSYWRGNGVSYANPIVFAQMVLPQ
jgi:hypothetical protein